MGQFNPLEGAVENLQLNLDEPSYRLQAQAQQWFKQPLGTLLAEREQVLLDQLVAPLFGSYWLHYSALPKATLNTSELRTQVRLGAPAADVQIICQEQAWPIAEHSADLLVLQHALDFCQSPHALLREAARCVRPGGHLLVCGFNPRSLWGLRHYLAGGALGKAHFIAPRRVADWLSLLGFALEKEQFGCYRPPLWGVHWLDKCSALERLSERRQWPGGGFYVLLARKLMAGLRPLPKPRRAARGQLLPVPVAQVSRHESTKRVEGD